MGGNLGGKGASAIGVIGGCCSVPVQGWDPEERQSLHVTVLGGGCG